MTMLRQYTARLIFRISLFLVVLYCYFRPGSFGNMEEELNFLGHIRPIHIIWAILIAGMVVQILPKSKLTMSCLKQYNAYYHPPEKAYNELKLYKYVQKMNIRAMVVLLLWIFFNAIFALLYLNGIIAIPELILLTMFYYVCDLICMIFWCPFQSFIMKNRCCVNCRIYNWGHFMMYTPMILIKSFFTWSLFFMSLLILIIWELNYLRHPERFWEGSNPALQCKNCQDNICKIKKPYYPLDK